jgi:hypothetical protein
MTRSRILAPDFSIPGHVSWKIEAIKGGKNYPIQAAWYVQHYLKAIGTADDIIPRRHLYPSIYSNRLSVSERMPRSLQHFAKMNDTTYLGAVGSMNLT